MATRDRNTTVGFAPARVEGGEPMPGLIVAARGVPAGPVTNDLLLIDDRVRHAELDGRIEYIPY